MSKSNDVKDAKINVAILGLGSIATKMAETLAGMEKDPRYADAVHFYAVASRNDEEKARKFASDYGAEKYYGTYEDMLNDEEVDLVYIATPHSFHAEQAKACLEQGKNVLVEKSFAATEEEAKEVLDLSKEKGLLCTEALWTRYEPSRMMIYEMAHRPGELGIGPVESIRADLSYPDSGKPRVTDPALAGGALLDVGVYVINFMRMIFPDVSPHDILTTARLTETKVDESNIIAIWLDNGVKAVLTSGRNSASDRQGIIQGQNGYIIVDNVNNPMRIDRYNKDHELMETVKAPDQITGFEYEVMASVEAIRSGQIECQQMPHEETRFIMQLMDALRHNWGVWYPFEDKGKED
ncbi:oxidoreductase, NAD-binding domain protein [Parascardovia denticolens DSM 10105 = JCM 12538]|uniref:Oxidoreductase, NAD-binding domain protein n=1 Tax=Parascardovia denticolens DSM 10105 = JCM 12538 TaxID=864564 RepID=E6JY97_PARDN|nr:Gfo/Idh/MocA family oxidoreductase [Parascardovia denticolens]EFG33341.1 hypothetical protein HMPREF9017_00755 [Parascardovia denticolens F0305]EFT83774.1 oxidoreductase, NAD-binding domain protein [Parascardovia denticolens DSM 10105 = JCM 12538]BAR05370.1 putative oxidoreductase [Parascardovia denticolens DSM 10105 = JCM 12538]